MEKKSRKGFSSHGRLQAGCVSGLINIFDFRHGRSRWLLSDRKPSIKQTSVQMDHDEGSEGTEESKESAILMIGVGKISVKELMDEDMLNEEVMMNPSCHNSEIGDGGITSIVENHLTMNQNRQSETESQSVSERDEAMCSYQKTSDSHVHEIIEEHLAKINTEFIADNGFPGVLDMLLAQAVTETDKKLVEAVKLLMEQKPSNLGNSEEEDPYIYEKFMDAVQILIANYGLFLELLQESKAVQVEACETPMLVSNLLDCKLGNLKADGFHSHKQLYFLRKKRKSLENLVPGRKKGTDDAIRSSTLPYFQVYNNVQEERNKWFKFSFNEIKRKLWHSMVREKTVISSDKLMFQYSSTQQNRKNSRRHSLRENLGWSSPNRNHFYTERFTLPSPGRKREHGMGEITSQNRRVGGFDIDNEAKRHISKMLTNVDENIDSKTRQMPRCLARILSDPVNHTPICLTIRELLGDTSISEGVDSEENKDKHPSSTGENLNRQPYTMGDDTCGKMNTIETNVCIPSRDDEKFSLESKTIHLLEIGDIPESRPEKGQVVHEFSESRNNSADRNTQDAGTIETNNEDHFGQCFESSQCTKSDLCEEDGMFSSSSVSMSHSSIIRELEDCDHAIDKLEQPSPVSVLESLFMDDASSPASILSAPAREMEPQHINFEEQSLVSDEGICTRISKEEVESPFEYVEAVLLGSGLDWNEFHVRWLSSREILDSSIFEEVEPFSNRSHCDQKLLFDCANEALLGVCNTCFSCFTCKEKIESFQSSMDLINEIWKQVEWRLFHQVQATSLNQLVLLDLARTGKWTNLQPDIELFCFEIEEAILDVLMEDTILSFEKASTHHKLPPVIAQDESVAANYTTS